MAAFELALTDGADALELDAKLSSDGRIVVFHDVMLERTTNGKGRVRGKSLTELRRLDAGSYFSERFRGEKIPLLEEVFDAFGQKTLINIELKNYDTPGDKLVEGVCDLVVKCGLQERIIFSSFLAGNLDKARRLLPDVPRGLLAARHIAGAWARSFGFSFGDYAFLDPCTEDVDSHTVQRVHRLKRRVLVWTVNEAEEMLRLKGWGVDGIFTDDPALAVQVLRRPE